MREHLVTLGMWAVAAMLAFAVFNGLVSGRAFGQNGERIPRDTRPVKYWLYIAWATLTGAVLGWVAIGRLGWFG